MDLLIVKASVIELKNQVVNICLDMRFDDSVSHDDLFKKCLKVLEGLDDLEEKL